jgi:protein-disulfide isomerase
MQQTNKLIVPVSIIIAGALIAFAVYAGGNGQINNKGANVGTKGIVADALKKPAAPEIEVAPVTSADHIRGKADAKVVIVEYSDTECPFCQRFQVTLNQIFNEYGPSNKVAWVYRHFPLDMHNKAPKEAEATECANELGGADMFWKYIDLVYKSTPTNNKLDPAELPKFADQVGLDSAAFKKCLDSGKYAAKVQAAKESGFKAGARGTPYTVLLTNVKGKVETVPLVDADGNGLGALPYATLKNVIDKILNS